MSENTKEPETANGGIIEPASDAKQETAAEKEEGKTAQMQPKQKRTFKQFMKYYANRYFVCALSYMAKGLFASLLVGTILAQLGKIPFLEPYLAPIAKVAQNGFVVGAAIGAAIAIGLKAKPLTVCSAIVVGAIGYTSGAGGAGPLGAYIAALVGIEFGRLVEGKTKVDILVVPIVALLTGGGIGLLLGAPLGAFMKWLAMLIGNATYLSPLPMGIIISVVMGLILTAPISSAAVCAMIFVAADGASPEVLEGIALAAGAATIGCSCHMVGFAAASFRENRWGGVLSQGLGTSMLQISNILKHPAILIPPVLTSALLGPLGTVVFHMKNMGVAAGMGTCGLVGQIGTFTTMLGTTPWWQILLEVLLLHIVAPALISLLFSEALRRLNVIKYGDMKLD